MCVQMMATAQRAFVNRAKRHYREVRINLKLDQECHCINLRMTAAVAAAGAVNTGAAVVMRTMTLAFSMI